MAVESTPLAPVQHLRHRCRRSASDRSIRKLAVVLNAIVQFQCALDLKKDNDAVCNEVREDDGDAREPLRQQLPSENANHAMHLTDKRISDETDLATPTNHKVLGILSTSTLAEPMHQANLGEAGLAPVKSTPMTQSSYSTHLSSPLTNSITDTSVACSDMSQSTHAHSSVEIYIDDKAQLLGQQQLNNVPQWTPSTMINSEARQAPLQRQSSPIAHGGLADERMLDGFCNSLVKLCSLPLIMIVVSVLVLLQRFHVVEDNK